MSFNGSGTFVINSAGQPVVSGTVISSTAFNALTADLANGLSTCITKDGQTTPTADIPMGSNKITGLANGTAAGDAANLGQVQSTVAKLLGSVSGADTITAIGAPTVAAYAAGQMFYFVAAGANTGAVTINIDSLGAKSITRDGTTALAAGDIQSGEVCVIVYDGTQFQLVNGASQSAAIVTNSLTVNGTSSLDGAVTINDSGADVDFRVEGDTDANLLFVDASADFVGIGTNSPAVKLDVAGRAQFVNSGFNYVLVDSTVSDSYVRLAAAGTVKWYFRNNTANTDALEITPDAGSTTGLFLTQSGNLGLGVTPSAGNAGINAFQIGALNGLYMMGGAGVAQIGSNYYFSAGYKYGTTGAATNYETEAGAHKWYTAPSGTAGDPITFTQAMTLTADGRLGIATTTPNEKLQVNGAIRASGAIEANSTGTVIAYESDLSLIGAWGPDNSTRGTIRFYRAYANGSGGAESARITSGGDFLIGQTSKDFAKFEVSAADDWVSYFENTRSSGTTRGIRVTYNAASPNNTADWFLYCDDTTVERASIRSNGGLANYSANNVNLASDERLKKDIAPLDSTWGKVKGIEVVNYRYKDCHEGDPALYGVIAQQVQPIVPELVVVTREAKEAQDAVLDDEGNVVTPAVEASPEYYGIREQPMYWLAIKALQEAMTRIEALEAEMAALKGAN